MANRAKINQTMPLIGEPIAVIKRADLMALTNGELEALPLYFTEPYRLSAEAENDALFGDGANDATLEIPSGSYVGGVIDDASNGLTASGVPAPGYTITFTLSRNITADGAKLDNIESNATADQTDAEIKTAYEANSDTNAFTDALQFKLNNIAAGATANATDAQLRDRATHTGSAPISSVTNLQSSLDGKVSKDATITNAETAHSLNATFSDTEVEAALDALGAKLNEVIAKLSA